MVRDVREALIVAVLVTVCGLALGALWLWLAPRVPLVSDGSAIYLKDSEGEQAIGADGWFTLLGLGMGVLTAAGVYFWRRTGGIVLVVALAVGGLLASVLAWRLGVHFGPPQNVVAHAKQLGANKVFSAPLQLNAKGALLAWPIASMAAFLGLTSLFTPFEEADPDSGWPGWEPRHPEPPQERADETGTATVTGTGAEEHTAATPDAAATPEPGPDQDAGPEERGDGHSDGDTHGDGDGEEHGDGDSRP